MRRKDDILTKIALIVFSVFIAVIILYFMFLKVTYIDDTVDSGEAYGFRIGDDKENSYKKARQIFADKKVYILYPLGLNKHGPHKRFLFLGNEYQMIEARKVWEIYFNEGFFDFIKLTFENDALTSIYRHRKNFELP